MSKARMPRASGDGNELGRERLVQDIDYGFVGDLPADAVNTGLAGAANCKPVCCPWCAITHDGHGQLLTNADTIASAGFAAPCPAIANRGAAFFREKRVLSNVNDDNSGFRASRWCALPELKAAGVAARHGACSITPLLPRSWRGLRVVIDNALTHQRARKTVAPELIDTLTADAPSSC
jgi:acetylglutamate kinase